MSRKQRLPKDAAQYYDWLVGQSFTIENQIKQVPKISLEEQANPWVLTQVNTHHKIYKK